MSVPWWVWLIGIALIVGGIYSALPDWMHRWHRHRRRVEKRRRKAAKLRRQRQKRWDRRFAYWRSMLPASLSDEDRERAREEPG